MAKIKVISKCELYDGMSITFRSPCDCTAVDGLNVYYNGSAQTFSFQDTHGNNLTGIDNLFNAGVYVKAILNTTDNYAYLQNADSNAYLEEKLSEAQSTAIGLAELKSIISEDYGIYKKHWWKIVKTITTTSDVFVEKLTAISADVDITTWDTSTFAETTQTIQYASSISINQSTGELALVDPQSMEATGAFPENVATLAPVYITNLAGNPTGIYYLPSGATYGFDYGGGSIYTVLGGTPGNAYLGSAADILARLVSVVESSETEVSYETTYAQSDARNAYPDSGKNGALTYEYLGIPFENMSTGERVSLTTVAALVNADLGQDGSGLVTTGASGTYGCISGGAIGDVNSAVITFSFENLPDTARICYMGNFTVTGSGSSGSSPTYTTTIVARINGGVVDLGLTSGTPYSGNFYADCNFVAAYGRPLNNTDTLEITVSVERTSSGGTNQRTCSHISSCVFQYMDVY